MPFMCDIHATYANYIMCRYETAMSVYILYEATAVNSITRSTGVHHTLLAYAPKQICLPHHT